MSKIRYKLFINDNQMYLLDTKKNKKYEKVFINLKKDEITDEQKFYFELNQFIRKSKIKIPLFGYKVLFYINDNINDIQKNKFKEFLEDYFQKVIFLKLSNQLPLNKNTVILNVTENYIDIFGIKKSEKYVLRIENVIFNNNPFNTIKHIIQTLIKPKKIILFGTNNKIPKLTDKINKELNINSYYYEDYTNYFLEE